MSSQTSSLINKINWVIFEGIKEYFLFFEDGIAQRNRRIGLVRS
ncbi:MAG: hypothetical protein ACJAU0_001599 [Flavobacteriales bacterium]|jgi:hypothetical protein